MFCLAGTKDQNKQFKFRTLGEKNKTVHCRTHFVKCTPHLQTKTQLASVSPTTAFGEIYVHHLSLNREGRWGTTDDFTTSFFYFFLFSTALWDLLNSSRVHSLMLSSHLSLCLPCLLPPFTVPCKMVLARPDERET